MTVDEIISYSNYYRLASFDPEVEKKRYQDLIAFSRNLHELIWTAAKISEEDKPLKLPADMVPVCAEVVPAFILFQPEIVTL